MSGQHDEVRNAAGDSEGELTPASDKLIAVMQRCWSAVNQSYIEAKLIQNQGIRYSASRDMANVLRAVLPPAVEFAAMARPEWANADSPLAEVAGRYALALASRDNALDVLADGFAPLLETQENSEAFCLFGSSLAFSLLIYMLCTPHLADTVGELCPELSEKAVSAIGRAAALESGAGGIRGMLAKRLRRDSLRKSLASGALPECDWVARFAKPAVPGAIWDILNHLVAQGAITDEETRAAADAGKEVDDETAGTGQ